MVLEADFRFQTSNRDNSSSFSKQTGAAGLEQVEDGHHTFASLHAGIFRHSQPRRNAQNPNIEIPKWIMLLDSAALLHTANPKVIKDLPRLFTSLWRSGMNKTDKIISCHVPKFIIATVDGPRQSL
jgi:hypothetical protein